MAEKSKSKSSGNQRKGGGAVTLNKTAFFTLAAASIVYLVTIILSAVGVASSVVAWIGAAISVLLYFFAAVLAWRYVKNKPAVWIILYVLIVCILIVGVVLPVALV